MLFEKYAVKRKVFNMSKEDIEVDSEHHEEKHEDEQSTTIANEGEEVESSEVEVKKRKKRLMSLKRKIKTFQIK